MNSIYKRNKERAIYRNDEPTMTDQAGAKETDINIIVGRFMVSNQLPTNGQEPIYADFTHLPEDLRGFIETAQSLAEHRQNLPEALRDMPIEELLALTPEELTNKLTPPAPEPASRTASTTEHKETKE